MDIPQLWDLGEDPPSPLEESEGLARAYDADITMADRLRGWLGESVSVRTVDSRTIRGTVSEVYRDALLIEDERGTTLVPLAAALRALGPLRGHVTARGRQRASGLGVVRDRTGAGVLVGVLGGGGVRGVVAAVGSDHVTLAVPDGEEVIPWSAVTSVEWPRHPR